MFPESWSTAGIVTDEVATAFARYAREAPERSERHWKWMAFQDHLEERTPLPEAECRVLYALGRTEPDSNLGTAIQCAILYQRHCPIDVKRVALDSGRAVLQRAVRFGPRGITSMP